MPQKVLKSADASAQVSAHEVLRLLFARRRQSYIGLPQRLVGWRFYGRFLLSKRKFNIINFNNKILSNNYIMQYKVCDANHPARGN